VGYRLRVATLDDELCLRHLIARSIRGLGSEDYTPGQIDAALLGAFGVDTAIIHDETYFVAVTDASVIAACGGWSKRRTLFGSDEGTERDESWLDSRCEPARIRAFFVDPAHARRGLGRAILARSEVQAIRAGFSAFELMATLPGVRLYESCGYRRGEAIEHALPGGQSIRLVPMSKQMPVIAPASVIEALRRRGC
jgi:GNAT superfamily N-acetyltransferase